MDRFYCFIANILVMLNDWRTIVLESETLMRPYGINQMSESEGDIVSLVDIRVRSILKVRHSWSDI